MNGFSRGRCASDLLYGVRQAGGFTRARLRDKKRAEGRTHRSFPSEAFEASKERIMPESSLILSDEERMFLVELLQVVMKDTRLEEHRTRVLSYRDHILHREHLIAGLLSKLGTAKTEPRPSASGKSTAP
jgi:hypothetical protein